MNRKRWQVAAVAVCALFILLGSAVSGDLNPKAPPAPTMKTLDQVRSWSVKIDNVAERFVVLADFNNEAVLDRETGLVWQKTASTPTDSMPFNGLAEYWCLGQATGGRRGWRLPTISEFLTLGNVLVEGHPLRQQGMPSGFWSSTKSYYELPGGRYRFGLGNGGLASADREDVNYWRLWCVRGPE